MTKTYFCLSALAVGFGFAFVGQPKAGPEPAAITIGSNAHSLAPQAPSRIPASAPKENFSPVDSPRPEEALGEEAEYRRDKDYELNAEEAVVGISLEEMARTRRIR